MTHGSLFDGAGGLRIGFEQAGFQTLWALDILNGQDINKANPEKYERPDVISGGPPCQKGSIACAPSLRTKVTLWRPMLQFIAACKPAWCVVENVIGFLPEMLEWSRQLQQLGYGCCGQCIDSRHWVPQQRTRAFIVGRLGAEGMALWHHLYAAGQQLQTREPAEARQNVSSFHYRSCPDCMRNGVPARIPAWDFAQLGGGNAVTVPVGRFLAEAIARVERTYYSQPQT
jgi:site-specific DNA-cytosine methylase